MRESRLRIALVIFATFFIGACENSFMTRNGTPLVCGAEDSLKTQEGVQLACGVLDSKTKVSDKISPPYRSILEKSGWVEYVNGNIDVVRYYDYTVLKGSSGPATGLSYFWFWYGYRIADVAIKGRTDSEITTTIVHEAAHLSGIRQIGDYFDEKTAKSIESRFRRDILFIDTPH